MTQQGTMDIKKAISLHQAGHLDQARAAYIHILQTNPDHAEATHFLGMLEHHAGNGQLGLKHLYKSVEIAKNIGYFYSNLGNTLKDLGFLKEAIQAYQQGIQIDPNFVITRYNLARLWGQQGNLAEAIQELDNAIKIDASFVEAWKLLGKFQNQSGQPHQAKVSLQQAILLRPQDPELWFHLSECHNALAEWEHSRKALEQALKTKPHFPEAINNLGLVFKELGKFEEARRCFQQAIQMDPGFLDPLNNLGQLAREKGRKEESWNLHQQALRLNPQDAQSHFCLANLLVDLGKLELAVEHFQKALQIRPNFPQALNNLGNVLMSLKRNDEARDVFEEAIGSKPDFYEAHANLGNLNKEIGFPDLAEKAILEAIRLKPDFAAGYSNLGNAYFDQGKFELALEHYRKGIELGQDTGDFVSNYLFCLNYGPDFSDQWVAEEHNRLCKEKFGHLRSHEPFALAPNPRKRLRIGYVSPDFGAHPVARFMHPILKHHDRSRFEVFVYSLRYLKDPVTRICQQEVENWRDHYGSDDEELAQAIRKDRIDVLFDLVMHSRDCRPRLFARKPAPVQIAYLAYPGTTGLPTMDYRITDPFLDPPEPDQGPFIEVPKRMPNSWWCYMPPLETSIPTPGESPFSQNGYITFGCLNNFIKVHDVIKEKWAQILRNHPESKIIIHVKKGNHRKNLINFFEERGISAKRIEMIGYQDTLPYFETYLKIDIALDTYPFAGGTTTCDALYMGIPVVTWSGNRIVSRGGESILRTIGHPEWIAKSGEDYVQKATELAAQKERLGHLRKSLRETMLQSPLMDAKRFTKHFEDIIESSFDTHQKKTQPPSPFVP